jgi:hypothetical protein
MSWPFAVNGLRNLQRRFLIIRFAAGNMDNTREFYIVVKKWFPSGELKIVRLSRN